MSRSRSPYLPPSKTGGKTMTTQKGTTIRPNIVYILADNVGWGDFSCYGGSRPTPRIDKLASEGIRFNNYTIESQCTPTRTAIMTGRQSVRCGTYTVIPGQGKLGLTPWEYTIAELRDIAVWQVAPWRHRGSVADGSRLRRVVGVPKLRRRGRLRSLCIVPGAGEGEGDRIAQDLGGQERSEVHSGPRTGHENTPAAGRDDRREGDGLHQAKRQQRQTVLHLRRPLAYSPAGEGPS